MPELLRPLRLKSAANHPRVAWCEGLRVFVPERALDTAGLRSHVDREGNLSLPGSDISLPESEAEGLRERAAFTDRKPLSSVLPFSYKLIPAPLRVAAASLIGRAKRRRLESDAGFPGWPLDLSADFLSDLAGGPVSPFRDGPTPVVLSHDLDSAEGIETVVGHFLAIEEDAGARSVNFVVPRAWEMDHGLLREIASRGHEIGMHGYNHGNKTAFCPQPEMRRRLDDALTALAGYPIAGYRAPSLLRTRGLIREIGARFAYDSSIPTSGGVFPVPGNGCASARPFTVEGTAELPLSMPRDGSLIFLGHTPEEILALWLRCAETISASGGVVVLLTHGEKRFSGNSRMTECYRAFLAHISSSSRYRWSTPAEVLRESGLLPARRKTPEA